MDSFVIEISGLCVCVQPMFASTRDYCRKYLSTCTPDCYVEVTEGDLIYEQQMLDMEAAEEGLRPRKFTGPFLERASIQRKVADILIARNTILVHGSTVAVDGDAYLFTAACGTGKSTHTRFWCETFGDRAVMVNDDKPFLQITPRGVTAFGSPWSGKHGLDSNIAVPLKGICILHRGFENTIRQITANDARAMLLHQSHAPDNAAMRTQVSALVEELMEKVPLWEMMCTKDPIAAKIAFDAMSSV